MRISGGCLSAPINCSQYFRGHHVRHCRPVNQLRLGADIYEALQAMALRGCGSFRPSLSTYSTRAIAARRRLSASNVCVTSMVASCTVKQAQSVPDVRSNSLISYLSLKRHFKLPSQDENQSLMKCLRVKETKSKRPLQNTKMSCL